VFVVLDKELKLGRQNQLLVIHKPGLDFGNYSSLVSEINNEA
jgi:hypothetical protein